MNCAEIQAELQRQLDVGQLDVGLTGDDDRIREHCLTCSVCSEAWDSARLLSDSIAIWRDQVPDVDLVEAVLAAHRRSISTDSIVAVNSGVECVDQHAGRDCAPVRVAIEPLRSGFSRSRQVIFAALACLAALIAVSFLTPSGNVPPPAETLPAITASMPSVQSDAARSEVALLNHAEAAYDTLTTSAVGALEEFASIVIPIRLTDSEIEHGDAPRGHWIDGLQDQLQPLQDGLGEALEFLRDAGISKNTRT